MKEPNRNPLLAAGLTVIVLALAACSELTPTVRHEIYPAGFDSTSPAELNSRMLQLGNELQRLDLALASQEDDPPDLQQRVVGSLREIERIAGFLQSGEINTNHPFLRNDMSVFLGDVRAAQQSAASSPPRYYLAGRITGSCINCHRANRS